jgi:O-antigen/teichoic acid export membrane protein
MSSLEIPSADPAKDEQPTEGLARLDLRSLWRNASWTSSLLVVSTALLLLETVLVARLLGATVLGYFVLIRAYPEAVQQVLDCRTYETMVRYLGEFVALDERERAGVVVRLIWMVDAAAGLIAMAIVLATASIAARYVVHDSAATGLVALYAVSQFVGTLDSASGSVVRVFDRFRLASLMGICLAVVRFVGIVVVLVMGGGVAPLIYVLVGVEITYTMASATVAFVLLRRRIGFRIWGNIRALEKRRKEMLKFLLHTNIAGTLKMSSAKLALVIVGALGGAPIAAQYKVASQTGGSLMLFSDPFYQVIYPPLSRLVALRRWDAVFADLRRLRRTTLTFAIPAAVTASVLMVPLIPIMFGGQFAPAVIPGIVVLWAMVPNVVIFWRRPLLLSLHEAGRLVRYGAVASSLQLVLTLALVKPLGALGAALGVLGAQWLYAALEIQLIGRHRRRLQSEG